MDSIPDEIRRFILTSVPSVPYLEAALLLRADAAHERTSVEVARALYMPERAVHELLESLCAAGLVQCGSTEPVRYRYKPRDSALANTLDQLAAIYASNLIGVTKLIHDATQKNATRFANAFKLRKDS